VKRISIPWWLPAAFFLAAYILPLGFRPLFAPDEFRYAEIPRAMLHSGNWVSPRLLGVRYFEKPAFGYQLTAAAMAVFGENRFADRLPSALAAGMTALIIAVYLKRRTGNRQIALLGALMWLGAGLVYGIGTYAVLDMQTTCFLAFGMFLYHLALFEEPRRTRWMLLALSGGGFGLAFLTKGFLAFAVPAVAILPYLIWSRQYRKIFTTPWIPLLAAALVALPWSLQIYAREPYFWHYFFWVEHVQRFFASEESGQHPAPFWLLVPVLAGGVFPAALAAFGAFAALRKHFRTFLHNDMCRYLTCFLVFPFLLFSASSGKLATYVLPCFPAAAALLAIGAYRYLREGGTALFNWPLRVFGWLLLTAAAGLTVMQLFIFSLFGPGETVAWIAAALAAVAWACLIWWFRKDASLRLSAFFGGMALLFAAAQAAFPAMVTEGKAQENAFEKFSVLLPPDAVVVSARTTMHAAGWVLGRDDIDFFLEPGELEDSVEKAFPEEYGHRLYSYRKLRDLIARTDRPAVVVTVKIKPSKFDRDRADYTGKLGEPLMECYIDEIWFAYY